VRAVPGKRCEESCSGLYRERGLNGPEKCPPPARHTALKRDLKTSSQSCLIFSSSFYPFPFALFLC
jgi:hypothetical protein